jgi:transcriptional regulator with XRE-family HTH domain
MQPEQLRAARAALNWSLDRVAEAAGVHRNTLSNFETRKYNGEPEKIAAAKRALEAAGVIFTDENDEAGGVTLRRFQVGDLVRFRPQTRVRFDFNIGANELGTVVGVELHPPRTGPTYQIQVQFERSLVPYVFRFEYELIRVAPNTNPLNCEDKMMACDPKTIIDRFCTEYEYACIDYRLYESVCEVDKSTQELFDSVAQHFFGDLRRVLIGHLFQQFTKITDPAKTGKNFNLTTNYILEELDWPSDVREQLSEVNQRLLTFRKMTEEARNKRIAHVDLFSQTKRLENLGQFPKGADKKFLRDLQTFVSIAYGHLHHGAPCEIDPGTTSIDTHQLVRALQKSLLFDRCSKCDASERAVAILDYEESSVLHARQG